SVFLDDDRTAEEGALPRTAFRAAKHRAGTYARGDEFDGGVGAGLRVRIDGKSPGNMGMVVAGAGDDIADLFALQEIHQLTELAGVALPAIRADIAVLKAGKGEAREIEPHGERGHAVRPDAPARLRCLHRRLEPRFLRAAHMRAMRR